MQITFDSVTQRFEQVTAVDAVSFRIEQGECFFLLGPSGCGKTTVLRMIAGFGVPDSGRILFDGVIVNNLPPHKRNTGMVFQQYALWPHMTVYRNIEFGLTSPGRNPGGAERRRRVQRIMDIARIEELAERKPNQLSGGQQQRVALARALVVEPGCLLLDEPLSNLDARLRIELRVEIKRIMRETGITTVYVTHDQEEALSMADRCAIMRNGRIEQIAAPRELYERPANRFTAEFVGGSNLIPGSVLSVMGERFLVRTAVGDWTGSIAGGALAVGAKVVIAIRPEKLRVSTSNAEDLNTFPGKLTEIMYYGNIVEYWVSLSKGVQVKVAGTEGVTLPVGSDVQCRADPADIVILPEEDG